MAHAAKYTRAQVSGLSRHYERAKEQTTGEYIKFGNEDIDISRTHLNYNLAPERNQLEFISSRCAELDCLKREDVNVMVSWVVTAPRCPETAELLLNEDEIPSYFENAYKFLNNRYFGGSDKNIISCYVHLDETTPHMHWSAVPVVEVEDTPRKPRRKKGEDKAAHDAAWEIKLEQLREEAGGKFPMVERVVAANMVNRNELQLFHQDLDKHMQIKFGRDIGILNNATEVITYIDRDGNERQRKQSISKKQMQAQANLEAAKDKNQKAIDAYNKQIELFNAARKEYRAATKDLESKIKAAVNTGWEITSAVRSARPATQPIIGKAKSYDDLSDNDKIIIEKGTLEKIAATAYEKIEASEQNHAIWKKIKGMFPNAENINDFLQNTRNSLYQLSQIKDLANTNIEIQKILSENIHEYKSVIERLREAEQKINQQPKSALARDKSRERGGHQHRL